MIKRILSVILTMTVLLMMTPVWGMTANSAEVDETDPNHHDHSGWTVLESNARGVTLESGDYYLNDLNDSITLIRAYQIQENARVNLCLNGHDITGTGFDGYIKVLSGGELNIYDCREDCGKVINDTNRPIMTGGNAKITLYNGRIEHNGTGSNAYCISLNNGDILTVKGGSIYAAQSCVYSQSGTVIVEGGKIEGGVQGIYSQNNVEISGGEVIGGSCGAVNDKSGATMTISGTAKISGGEIGVSNKGTLTVTGGTITGNLLYGIESSKMDLATTDISGGVIKGGEYGIYTKSATILFGAPEITGDTVDLYLTSAYSFGRMNIKETLSNITPYRIFMDFPGIFTQSADTYLNVTDNFVPAQEHIENGYEIIKNSNGQLALALKTYTVTYDCGKYGEGTIDAVTETYGTSVTLSSDKFARTGYIQTGWATTDGGDKEYNFGDTYSANADITLYPAWTECGHDSEDPIWTDDENDDGTHSRICDDCGATVTKEHNWDEGEVTTAPTTTTDGVMIYTCTVCGAKKSEPIPKHEHHFGNEWEHDKNTHWHKCTDEDCPNGTDKGSEADHTWDSGKVTKEATATEKGEKTFECTVCGEKKTEEIPATGGGNTGSGTSRHPSTGTTTPTIPPTENNTPSTDDTTEPSTGDTGDTSDPSGDTSKPSTGDSTEPSNGNDAGNVTVNSESGENAPDVTISEETSAKLKEEVIAEHLTPEEKAAVENGDDLDVILVVEDAGDTVPAEDKQVTEAVLTDTEYTIGMYLNVDLIKLINGQQVGKITEISSPIHVTIEIPEELRSENRDFAIVRVHSGAAEILEDVDDDPDTITIVTDKFSTYSIAYQDTEVSDPDDDYSDDVNSDDTNSDDAASDNPNTGVATPIAVTGIACAVIISTVAVKRKKIIE